MVRRTPYKKGDAEITDLQESLMKLVEGSTTADSSEGNEHSYRITHTSRGDKEMETKMTITAGEKLIVSQDDEPCAYRLTRKYTVPQEVNSAITTENIMVDPITGEKFYRLDLDHCINVEGDWYELEFVASNVNRIKPSEESSDEPLITLNKVYRVPSTCSSNESSSVCDRKKFVLDLDIGLHSRNNTPSESVHLFSETQRDIGTVTGLTGCSGLSPVQAITSLSRNKSLLSGQSNILSKVALKLKYKNTSVVAAGKLNTSNQSAGVPTNVANKPMKGMTQSTLNKQLSSPRQLCPDNKPIKETCDNNGSEPIRSPFGNCDAIVRYQQDVMPHRPKTLRAKNMMAQPRGALGSPTPFPQPPASQVPNFYNQNASEFMNYNFYPSNLQSLPVHQISHIPPVSTTPSPRTQGPSPSAVPSYPRSSLHVSADSISASNGTHMQHSVVSHTSASSTANMMPVYLQPTKGNSMENQMQIALRSNERRDEKGEKGVPYGGVKSQESESTASRSSSSWGTIVVPSISSINPKCVQPRRANRIGRGCCSAGRIQSVDIPAEAINRIELGEYDIDSGDYYVSVDPKSARYAAATAHAQWAYQ